MQVKSRLEKEKQEIVSVGPETSVLDMMETMITKKIGCLPVIDGKGELVGIVDDKDIFRAVHKDAAGFEKLTAKDLMATDLLIGLPTDDINYIAGLMSNNDIRYVPIMDESKMVGLMSQGDVMEAQRRHIEIENRYLKMYMDGTHHG